MRVVSLVPSATEIIYMLGAGDEVVGVTYACDTPPEARMKDVVVKPIYEMDGLSEAEIDRVVSGAYARGESLYRVDMERIRSLRPDLIVAQSVCDVCAANTRDFSEDFWKIARVIQVGPRGVEEILADILTLGEGLGRYREATELVDSIRQRIHRVAEKSKPLGRRRVFFMEWLDPPFCSGHWVPELVELAGGLDLGLKGAHSRRVSEREIAEHRPEIIIAGPCGFNLEKAYSDARVLRKLWWAAEAMVYAVDAGRYFSRHGPGIAEAVEILAEIIHPETFRGIAPEKTYRLV
ncbi:Vitamin B12-binding protein [archaeon HR01]|nr:Vitamin B12-binding protein [archaeon HR01]